jgi:hypothetical protein
MACDRAACRAWFMPSRSGRLTLSDRARRQTWEKAFVAAGGAVSGKTRKGCGAGRRYAARRYPIAFSAVRST